MFTTNHTVSNNFMPVKEVSLEEFVEYHHFISSFIESDRMFKLFMSGVWNMDIIETTDMGVGPSKPAGIAPPIYGKNSREQWKYDMHRTFFGKLNETPMKQEI